MRRRVLYLRGGWTLTPGISFSNGIKLIALGVRGKREEGLDLASSLFPFFFFFSPYSNPDYNLRNGICTWFVVNRCLENSFNRQDLECDSVR